ncbi:MAG: type III-A CRISPR-associated protein Csm2 [Phototrophicaceae bacterium]
MSYSKNAPKSTASLIPDSELKKIITGDLVESAKLTNQHGSTVGEKLANKLNTTQIRNIFGMVRQIEMTWDSEPENAQRQLILLIPKLRYQTERKPEVEELAKLLIDAIYIVTDEKTVTPPIRDRFQRFVDMFEAILAYHKANGGK